MFRTRRLLLLSLLLLFGCRGGPVQQETDRVLLELASRPFDVAPADQKGKSEEKGSEEKASEEKGKPVSSLANPRSLLAQEPEADIRTVSLLQVGNAQEKQAGNLPRYELKVPPGIPGSEAPPLPELSKMTPEQKQKTIRQLYPELPPLPEEPAPQPGPNGQAYTLADLQKLAVENSPTLRQAVSDVKSAEGALVQAKTYQNPTVAYQASPTNNNSNAGAQGGYIDQPLRMWGKMKLGVAAAQKDLDNAQLALRRARSDLSTNVRNAYFALIVAEETMRVNRALARFTDEIYRLYTTYSAAGLVAPYEPAPLRASAFTNRLAYQQAIYGYIYAWKQLVATLGLPQLPLTQVAGRVDRLIPYYDYDKVLAHVLANHTDVLTARNGVQKAQYNLKLAQITPYPDIDVLGAVWKESTIAPYVIFYQAQVVMPIPVWDRNKGNIMSAQAALIRAVEETHRVENALTNTLATNYANYQNNLKALEYYRRWILPDQVRYYRGVFERRQADPAVAALPPADLVTAQQGLAAAVQTYLGILGSLWTSVVSVADQIQTPDLFQKELAIGRELPELPQLDQLPAWLCPHHRLATAPAGNLSPACPAGPTVKPVPVPGDNTTPMLPPAGDPVLPSPRKTSDAPALLPAAIQQLPQARPADLTQQLLEPPPEIPKGKEG
jgi:cobalt-zinc-cadmium efflux system outer membrane protein